MDRVFLDANVLFSAAYTQRSALRRLWSPGARQLLTSVYAAEEARVNLSSESRARLAELLTHVSLVAQPSPEMRLPSVLDLHEKDQPILLAAIHAQATHLLTGDLKHFGRLFERTFLGVEILTPAQYLSRL